MNDLRLGRLTDWLALNAGERADAVRSCLGRIHALDPQVHAWAHVAPDPVTGTGPLAGIPFGVKDIVETRGLPTEYGSPLYRGRMGEQDAAIVRALRGRGALLLGKTVTTEFSYRAPPATRNPRNLAHTPGGSSSGSAAAVAADMVPFTVGEQTLGSILRPASYCGVTGFKPTFGTLSAEGVLPLAPSLDTLGFFTALPEDMVALWDALGYARAAPGDLVLGVPRDLEVEAPMAMAFQDAIARVRAAGLTVRAVDVAPLLARASSAGRTVLHFEAARVHEKHLAEHGDELGELADVIRAGLATAKRSYEEAQQALAQCRSESATVFADAPVILTPAATGPAPAGYGSTGDPRMNAPWTALGTPAISIPMPVGEALPLGLQLTAERGRDARVLQAAEIVAGILHASAPVR